MENNELLHWGTKGMRWGVRRYQNKDGSLTPAGIKRYALKGYSQDLYNSNKTRIGKIYDRIDEENKKQQNAAKKKQTDHDKKSMQRITQKGKDRLDEMFRDEEKSLVRETIKTYSENDPDREEALEILREIEKYM